ncbi:hypothetical protein Afil01_19970 [Actinorhabdospora filicis]|uniref:Uncharacterized protein n=1 Tax=Actinorhabdospora filicis TaxID=1785913 RepID=A0A9W6SJP5_9ACTN|nr:hypothetical protein [Actinorhabdospora filicis]GLZ77190.1 hypothetical protein Afil01_19970 [Actinorhabdospora filicis]
MDYALHVHLAPPGGRARLTPLECEGAHRLLLTGLTRARPQGPPPELSVEPYVTHLDLRLEAPSLAAAEADCRRTVERVLAASKYLTDWRLESCAVQLDPDLDPEFAEGEFGDEDDGPDPDPPRALVLDGRASRLRAEAAKVTAFGPEIFGPDTDPDDADLVIGALMRSAELFLDILGEDVATLIRSGPHTVDASRLYIVSMLPQHYRHRYDLEFVRRFQAAAMKVVDRLAGPEWTLPGSLAEALALALIIESGDEALRPLEGVDLDGLRKLLAALRFQLLSNVDHESLYDLPADHPGDPVFAHLHVAHGVEDWFVPRRGRVHPYRQLPAAYENHVHDADCAPTVDEMRRVLADRVGVDPDRLMTVLDLAAIGLTDALWTHGPVMRWFGQRRISDGELLRTTMHTVHHVRESLREWRLASGIGVEATVADFAGAAETAPAFAAALGAWLTDPERVLSTGDTYGALAAGDRHEAVDHVAAVLGGFLRQIGELGLPRTLLGAAAQAGLTRYHWWGAPGWPDEVERIVALVSDPGRREWGPDGRLASGLPPRSAHLDGEHIRFALLHRPWTLRTDAAEWCARAAHLAGPEN